MRKGLALIAGALALSACATSPLRVEPTYFDEAAYADWPCARINSELEFITARVNYQSSQQLARQATYFMGNELVPLLAELKGKREALVRISTAKGCVIGRP